MLLTLQCYDSISRTTEKNLHKWKKTKHVCKLFFRDDNNNTWKRSCCRHGGTVGGGEEWLVGQGGTHAAETLSPAFCFFLKSVVSRASTALWVDLTTYGMVEVALVTWRVHAARGWGGRGVQERLSGAVMNTLHTADISGKGSLDLQITGRSKNFLHENGGRKVEGDVQATSRICNCKKCSALCKKTFGNGCNYHTSRSECEPSLKSRLEQLSSILEGRQHVELLTYCTK